MDGLGGADGRHVAVALICEQYVLGPEARGGGGYCRCAAVGGLDPVDVKIVVGEHGASHGGDAHHLLGEAHLGDHFRQYLVHHTVAAARAVVGVDLCEQPRTAVHPVGGF